MLTLFNVLPTLIVLAILWALHGKIVSSFKMCPVDNCPGYIINETGPAEILFENKQRVLRETNTEICDMCGRVRRFRVETPIPTKINR